MGVFVYIGFRVLVFGSSSSISMLLESCDQSFISIYVAQHMNLGFFGKCLVCVWYVFGRCLINF